MQKVTALQFDMLNKIATSPYNENDGMYLNSASESATWANCIIETAQDKGVFTSLLNAGMVYHIADGQDSLAGLTEAGFQAWKANK